LTFCWPIAYNFPRLKNWSTVYCALDRPFASHVKLNEFKLVLEEAKQFTNYVSLKREDNFL